MNDLDSFLTESEIDNVSVFEKSELGFSTDLDDNGFPKAKFFEVEVLLNNNADAKNLKAKIEENFKDIAKDFEIKKLKDKDWIKLYINELQPVICDGFYLYNDSIQQMPKDSEFIPIKLNSALAFGSGHHQTTQSCITNAKKLNDSGFAPKVILDMGCGTGVLGICAIKIWPESKLIGIDIDPEAVRVTKENYELNEVFADAFVGSDLKNVDKKFDLIFSNILKQPLIDLCPEFKETLNPRGFIITSGFITSQEPDIMRCYESSGFELYNRIQMEEWLSITFRKKW